MKTVIVLTIVFLASGGGEDKIHPKLYVITKENKNDFSRINVVAPDHCPEGILSSEDKKSHYRTALDFWRVKLDREPTFVVQVTAYKIVTECRQYWFRANVKSVVSDVPTRLDKVPQEELKQFLRLLSEDLLKLKPDAKSTEYLGQEIFDCETFSVSYTRKTLFVIRYKVLPSLWSLKGHLVQPFLLTNCNLQNGTSCQMDETSLLLWDVHSAGTACAVEKTASLGGSLYASEQENKVNLDKFISASSDVVLRFGQVDIMNFEPECVINNVPIFISPEGMMYSFATHNGYPVFVKNKAKWNIIKGLTSVNESDRARYRYKRQIDDVKDDVIDEMEFVMPKLPQLIDKRSTEKTIAKRQTSTISDIPLEFRDIWLAEHAAWSYSELQAQVFMVGNITDTEIQQNLLQKCKSTEYSLRIAQSILALNERPYIEILYKTRGFLSKMEDGNVYVNFGVPAYDVQIPMDLKWCNQSLEIEFRSDPKESLRKGYLADKIGLILEADHQPDCNEVGPSSFSIPLLKLGAYDVVSRKYINNIFPSSESEINPKNVLWAPIFNIPDQTKKEKLYESSLSSLNFPPGSVLNYQPHEDSIKNSSSFFSWLYHYYPEILLSGVIILILMMFIKLVICLWPTKKSNVSRLW